MPKHDIEQIKANYRFIQLAYKVREYSPNKQIRELCNKVRTQIHNGEILNSGDTMKIEQEFNRLNAKGQII